MASQKNFDEKRNFDGVYLRSVTTALIRHLHNRISWVNTFDSVGEQEVKVPFYFSLTGNERFLQDAFTDDVAWKRVEHNTDMVPRGIISPKSFTTKNAEFSNPNVSVLLNRDASNGQTERVIAPLKAVPVRLMFEAKIRIDSELDVFKCWEQLMDMLWNYRYFHFVHNDISISAVVTLPESFEDIILREFDLKTSDVVDMTFELTVHTYYPSVAWKRAKPAFPVDWVLNVWDKRSPK